MLSSLLLLGAALPAFGAVISPVRRDVSPSVRDNIERFSQYAAASNCAANHNKTSPGSPVYCDERECSFIREAETEIIDGFWGVNPGDTTGYLSVDKTNKLILIVYRGTVSDANGETDLMFQQVDASSACEGCLAHEGFWAATNAAVAYLQPKLESTIATYPDYKLTVVGHSLGGALATLSALNLRNAGHTLDLYTFGAPSVGNLKMAEYITAQGLGSNYRVTHTSDEVPKVLYRASRNLALQLITGIHVDEYSQTSPEYYITSGNGVAVTAADINLIEGVNNLDGNLGRWEITMEPHGWYMGNMSVCAEI